MGQALVKERSTKAAKPAVAKTQARKAAAPAAKTRVKPDPVPEVQDVKTRSPMHRKGSTTVTVDNPTTLGDRLVARRLELNLSQDDVSSQVTFYNKNGGTWKTLSRSGYCMYETGDVVPDLEKIKSLATALKCTPEWLTFGIGSRGTIEEVALKKAARGVSFQTVGTWSLDEAWMEDRFAVPGSDMVLIMVDDFSDRAKPGDMVFVAKDQMPTASAAAFAFARDGALVVAQLTTPPRSKMIRIYDADLRHYEEVDPTSIKILGRVVGAMGAL
ncbi:putative HTH domain DNA-binding protein [Brevundimonas phage vB_BpoS-Gurke]|uniref:HTH domain DNA-binding protein n=1 Tax=Brevundimonas phage vB_BpoS-Gurke TaxID=2948599 RepID=A0A9E7SQL3_9CAUD|nr:putative HTH domain DNA-binding protein [Brevundimonas phage vB_BpoS-Gurke]